MGNREKLVQVAKLPTWLGPIAAMKLESAGIRASVLDDVEGTIGAGGARIQVFESDADRARTILDDLA